MNKTTEEVTFNLPSSSCLRKHTFLFDSFDEAVFMPFLISFIQEIDTVFSQFVAWQCFSIFDPRCLPSSLNSVVAMDFNLDKILIQVFLMKLFTFFGVESKNCMPHPEAVGQSAVFEAFLNKLIKNS